jgi:hypothetical protein
MTRVFVEGLGVLGPGLQDWPSSRAILTGREVHDQSATIVPASTMLPPTERRRVGVPVKLALAVGQAALDHAGRAATDIATVFASSGGDGDNVHHICEALASADRQISPTRFHNSVHNAAAGYWSIATESRQASTSLACHDSSFAAGLLEAVSQVVAAKTPVTLIAYDHPYPYPLSVVRPMTADFAVAVVLVAEATPRAFAVLDVDFVAHTGAPTAMPDASLEALRVGVPAARCIPLLAMLAAERDGLVTLAYTPEAQLIVRVSRIAGKGSQAAV